MERSHENRATHVLLYGQNFEQWREWRGDLKGGLQSAHMGWSLKSFYAVNAIDAVKHIESSTDLEIVYFDNQVGITDDRIVKDAIQIARALRGHKYRPWVMLSSEFEYLDSVFKTFDIEIVYGMVENVVFERWRSQIPSQVHEEEVVSFL